MDARDDDNGKMDEYADQIKSHHQQILKSNNGTRLKSNSSKQLNIIPAHKIVNRIKELMGDVNSICKALHMHEIKSKSKLADDEFYIEIFERQFKEVDFSGLKGAESAEQKAENLQIMIDFLGNSVYEIDLSHIEAVEIIHGNFEHIQRFVKLLYEWTMFQTGFNSVNPKKHLEIGSLANVPTLDTYGNLNNYTNNHTIKQRQRLNIKI